jgi:hypothetical protein
VNTNGSRRKWPAIDVLALYNKGDADGWNRLLTSAYEREDVQWLKRTMYGLQAGMADIAETGFNSGKVTLWFLRIQRSLEDTAKKVFRKKYPHPLDNPMNASNKTYRDSIEVKRKRDQELQRFLNDARF